MRLMLFMTVFSIGLFGAMQPMLEADELLGVEVASLDEQPQANIKNAKRREAPELAPGSFEAAVFSAVTGSGPILEQAEKQLMHNPNSCGLGTHGVTVRESLLSRNTVHSGTGAKRMKAPKPRIVKSTPNSSGQICGIFSREPGCTPMVTAALDKWVFASKGPNTTLSSKEKLSDRQASVRTLLCKHR